MALRRTIFGGKYNGGTASIIPEYQQVLDYAAAQGLPIPESEQQQKTSDIIAALIAADVWHKLDVFYELEGTAPVDFKLIDLKRILKTEWYNQVDGFFDENGGHSLQGGTTWIATQYIPSAGPNFNRFDCSVGLKTNVGLGSLQILGGRVTYNADQINFWQSGGINPRVLKNYNAGVREDGTTYMTTIRRNLANTAYETNVYVDGIMEHTTSISPGNCHMEQYLLALNNNGTAATGNANLAYVWYGAGLDSKAAIINDILTN